MNPMDSVPADDGGGYDISPEVYDIGAGWDPRPEVNRLLFLARQAGVQAASVLELGCGTGRLLGHLSKVVPCVCGIELSPKMAEFARSRSGSEIFVQDMSGFALQRRFDLIFTSANTIRHVLDNAAIARMWQCIGEHLTPGGIFIADLELGFAAEAEKVGKPATWAISRDQTEVRVSWLVAEPPSPKTRCCEIEFTFEVRGERCPARWQERFQLRTYDGPEFLRLAGDGGGLEPRGVYELRDPHLLETPPEKATGRFLVVLQLPAATPR